jgi:glycosyltransferase involved in cell wall biosynthesis
MIEHILKNQKTTQLSYKFCVLIPTWNNLEYLKICINSILKNSYFKIQIIVIVNEGVDGTIDWLDNQGEIDYIHSKNNIGICYGLNIARSLIKSEYIVYVNDDMYLLPNWDLEFYKEIEHIGNKEFMLSGTMIEPVDSNNPCVIVKDFGQDHLSFKEELLLKEYSGLTKKDWNGSMWPPNVVHIDIWDLVGGLSIEFSPGMYSDPDFSMKLFKVGVRIFKGKGNCLAYHFGRKTTKRIKKNNGRKAFLFKWGMTPNTFTSVYLNLGKDFTGNILTPILDKKSVLLNRIKRIINSW